MDLISTPARYGLELVGGKKHPCYQSNTQMFLTRTAEHPRLTSSTLKTGNQNNSLSSYPLPLPVPCEKTYAGRPYVTDKSLCRHVYLFSIIGSVNACSFVLRLNFHSIPLKAVVFMFKQSIKSTTPLMLITFTLQVRTFSG